MKKSKSRALARVMLIAVAVAVTPPVANGQQALPFDGRWELHGDSTRIVSIDGRPTLRLETGAAYLRDVAFQDGTIDLDVKVTDRRSFVYVHFRMQDDGEYEEFYLRPHKSLMPDAVQYAPAFQGQSAWQLYYGPRGTTSVEIPHDTWKHLRIVLSGRRAAFFLGDTVKPFLVVPHLARDPKPGYVGLSAFVPPGTARGEVAAQFANLRINPAVAYSFDSIGAGPVPKPGAIRTWSVGPAFAAPESALSIIKPEWLTPMKQLQIEPDGFVELHRYVSMPAVTRYVAAVARVIVVAETAGMRRFDLGFSDRATVFLNGSPIFFRDDSYDYENRRDGLISLDQAAVYLPLRAGSNDLSIIVADRFGGWAIMGAFPDMKGLRIEAR